MVSDKEITEMARSNAEMAVDQRGAELDTIAAFAQNVRDTLAEWGVAQPRLVGMSAIHGAGAATRKVLGVYYARVAELLSAPIPETFSLMTSAAEYVTGYNAGTFSTTTNIRDAKKMSEREAREMLRIMKARFDNAAEMFSNS